MVSRQPPCKEEREVPSKAVVKQNRYQVNVQGMAYEIQRLDESRFSWERARACAQNVVDCRTSWTAIPCAALESRGRIYSTMGS